MIPATPIPIHSLHCGAPEEAQRGEEPRRLSSETGLEPLDNGIRLVQNTQDPTRPPIDTTTHFVAMADFLSGSVLF